MNGVLAEMLKKYQAESIANKKNVVKEVMQELVLCALSRSGFFKHAAFYGGTALNIGHLKARLVQSEAWKSEDKFTLDDAKKLLCERFDSIDYEQAKNDVRPFVKDAAALEIWNADFFKQITRELNFDTVSVL